MHRPILKGDRHIGMSKAHAIISVHRDLITYRYDLRVLYLALIVVSDYGRIFTQQRHSGSKTQAELALQSGLRLQNVTEAEIITANMHVDAGDIVRIDIVVALQGYRRFNRCMSAVTGSVVLEQHVWRVEGLAEPFKRRFRVVILGLGVRKTLLAFQTVEFSWTGALHATDPVIFRFRP